MSRIIIAIIVFLSACQTLYASTINYEVTSLGGNSWEYSYTVNNDMLAVNIEEFTIFFDFAFYENLSIGSTPSDWDPLVIQPEPLLFEDGLYDALAIFSGIAPGDSLTGFSVQFNYLGFGAPGSQYFEIVDPNDFTTPLDSGYTSRINQSVPEPGTLWLLLVSIIGWQVCRNTKNGTNVWLTSKKISPSLRVDVR